MKIKPCPFCARNPEVYKFNDRCFTVVCRCGAESPNDSVSEKGAIRIWNRRRLRNPDNLCPICKSTELMNASEWGYEDEPYCVSCKQYPGQEKTLVDVTDVRFL